MSEDKPSPSLEGDVCVEVSPHVRESGIWSPTIFALESGIQVQYLESGIHRVTVLDSITCLTWGNRLTSNKRSHSKSSVLKKLLISLKFITGRIVQAYYILQVAQYFLKNKQRKIQVMEFILI